MTLIFFLTFLGSVAQSCLPNPIVALQAPLPVESSKQEFRSGLPCPTLGDLPDPGMEAAPLVSPAWAGRVFTDAPHGKFQLF